MSLTKTQMAAVEIYLLYQDPVLDSGKTLGNILGIKCLLAQKFLRGVNVDEVIDVYMNISSGEFEIIRVKSSSTLDTETKDAIESKMKKTYGDKIFTIFEIDKEILGGLKIIKGDFVIDESVKSKIQI